MSGSFSDLTVQRLADDAQVRLTDLISAEMADNVKAIVIVNVASQ